jgi:SAM-dependent methyltransferase
VTPSCCRLCHARLSHLFVDLGMAPLSNSYLTTDQLGQMEPFYPLRALVCDQCFLVQVEAYQTPEHIFSDYAYFSSYSTTWLQHCEAYAGMATRRFELDRGSTVVEVASNDGYLLQYFAERSIRVLGIEPAANVAAAARARGIPTQVEFFGRECAVRLAPEFAADLVIGNNVLAHVPDLNDFIAGLRVLLKPRGVITMEFPHLVRLIEETQFDTIYHEHLSYLSLLTAQRAFAAHGLTLFDVEELPTHGGSLRIYARHAPDESRPISERIRELASRERKLGMLELDLYASFGERVRRSKRELVRFFLDYKEKNASIAGYGAPAKGNTLLNYCGIGTDFIDYTVDLNPHKQGRFLPGTHIPIKAPDEIRRTRPDLLFVLPWNLNDEIVQQMSFIEEWNGRFIVRTPELRVLP